VEVARLRTPSAGETARSDSLAFEMGHDSGTEQAAVGNGPTVFHRDELDRASSTVSEHILGRGAPIPDGAEGSFRSWRAHPLRVLRVSVDLHDEPIAALWVVGATDAWPVLSRQDVVDDQIEIESEKPQHWGLP
jgi:hypothetical protein